MSRAIPISYNCWFSWWNPPKVKFQLGAFSHGEPLLPPVQKCPKQPSAHSRAAEQRENRFVTYTSDVQKGDEESAIHSSQGAVGRCHTFGEHVATGVKGIRNNCGILFSGGAGHDTKSASSCSPWACWREFLAAQFLSSDQTPCWSMSIGLYNLCHGE